MFEDQRKIFLKERVIMDQQGNSLSSFIICTKDRFEEIMLCIESVETQSLPPDELIIIDSSSTMGLLDIIKDRFPSLPFPTHYFHTAPGLTYQRNIGVQRASGEYIFFFDDDVVLDNDYHEKVLEVYDTHSQAMGVGGVILN
ncbi:MAG: glycosyltransferase family 2 protein, partial [Candidatus Heimdallarchaeota archaeon]|nr:glycosyltransferase family 2 protein [Candidatus Heimdallarchaeota archaeon]